MKRIITGLMMLVSVGMAAQTDTGDKSGFVLGADISWSSEMVDKGYSFSNGKTKMSCQELIKEYGMTAARFRVWVNPASKYNAKDDVVSKAKAAVETGLDVLIDFHMSDTWADPSNQTVPAAWKDDTYTQMKAHLREHVADVLNALKDAGVTPRWVQIGNETNNGMLWNKGMASENPRQYAGFVNEGSKTVKEIFPDAQVIVHVSNAHDQSLFDWNIGIMKSNFTQYDIIGMSLYPGNDDSTAETVTKAMNNIRHLSSTFGKKVMIVETGVPVNSGAKGKAIIADILNRAQNDTNGACLGVFYWEPEAPSGWNYYQMGAATAVSKVVKFTTIMDAFKDAGIALGVESAVRDVENVRKPVYNLRGQQVAGPSRGIYVVDGVKRLMR